MDSNLLSLREMARALRVPQHWLRGEALSGRIPALRIGKRFLFNPEAVNRRVLKLAAEGRRSNEQ